MAKDQKQGGGVVAKEQDKPDSDTVVQKKEVPKTGDVTRQFMEYLLNNCHGCGM